MRNISIVQEKCTACFSCVDKCPQRCISVYENEEGFLFPQVDSTKCTDCKICVNHCHALGSKAEVEKKEAYFGRASEESVFKTGSSGGAFAAVVEAYKSSDTYIFGAAYNNDKEFYVSHIEAPGDNYQSLCKSKYVISDMQGAYKKALNRLEAGNKVIFVGTPCQIGGLKSFLNKDFENLLTLDFICHGVPSARILKEHLLFIEKKMNKKIMKVDFRSKKLGWRKHCLYIEFADGSFYNEVFRRDYYFNLFMAYSDLRQCCFKCQYSNKKHQSDITLADFWGINNYNTEIDDDKGHSLLIPNNAKGTATIDLIIDKKTMNLSQISDKYFGYVYKEHSKYPLDSRVVFFTEYKKLGYEKMAKRFYISLYTEKFRKGIVKIKNILKLN